MRRVAASLWLAAILAAAPAAALAQTAPEEPGAAGAREGAPADAQAPATQPAIAPATQPAFDPLAPIPEPNVRDTPATEPYVEPTSDHEMGARLGLQLGLGDVTPGGLRVAGVFLQRMTDLAWFDASVAATFGGGGASCFLDRDSPPSLVCDHGLVDGFGFQLDAGARMELDEQPGGLMPYVRTGLGIHLASFGGDDVMGGAIPLWVGAGGRFEVSEGVRVGGEAVFYAGPGFYDETLGLRFYSAMLIQFGVDLAL